MRPIDLVASMVLEDGARWGECATPDQWEDMTRPPDPGGPRRHFWLRARGRSKTTDTGAATVATMLAGGVRGGDEMYAAAAGREQAGAAGPQDPRHRRADPRARRARSRCRTSGSSPSAPGAVLDILSSDLATSWGKTPRWLFIDEICNHASGRASTATSSPAC